MRKNGTMISHAAEAAPPRQCSRRPRSAPILQAIGTSTTAPMATRPQATTPGEKSPTAILMNRYGMPQRALTAANVTHARAVMEGRDAFMPPMETWEIVVLAVVAALALLALGGAVANARRRR